VCESGLWGRGSVDFRREGRVGAVVKGGKGEEEKGGEAGNGWKIGGRRSLGKSRTFVAEGAVTGKGEGIRSTSRPSNEASCKVKIT
jgi:hypothetical protein